jgi:hypothetical protein
MSNLDFAGVLYEAFMPYSAIITVIYAVWFIRIVYNLITKKRKYVYGKKLQG